MYGSFVTQSESELNLKYNCHRVSTLLLELPIMAKLLLGSPFLILVKDVVSTAKVTVQGGRQEADYR
jgi:hypothetical protein